MQRDEPKWNYELFSDVKKWPSDRYFRENSHLIGML